MERSEKRVQEELVPKEVQSFTMGPRIEEEALLQPNPDDSVSTPSPASGERDTASEEDSI
jgi:hypothetical protein